MNEDIPLTSQQKTFRMLVFIFILLIAITFLLMLIYVNTDTQKHKFIVIQQTDDSLVKTLNNYGSQGCTIVTSRRAVVDTTGLYEIIMQCPGVTQ